MFEFGWCQNSNMSWALRPFDGEIFIFSYWLHQRVFNFTLVASKVEKIKKTGEGGHTWIDSFDKTPLWPNPSHPW